MREGRAEGDPLELNVYDLKEVPFPMDSSEPAPSTPAGPKSRSVHITVERILRFKETRGCKGCAGTSRLHTEECRKRFAALAEAEKAEAREKREDPMPAEGAAPIALRQLKLTSSCLKKNQKFQPL